MRYEFRKWPPVRGRQSTVGFGVVVPPIDRLGTIVVLDGEPYKVIGMTPAEDGAAPMALVEPTGSVDIRQVKLEPPVAAPAEKPPHVGGRVAAEGGEA